MTEQQKPPVDPQGTQPDAERLDVAREAEHPL